MENEKKRKLPGSKCNTGHQGISGKDGIINGTNGEEGPKGDSGIRCPPKTINTKIF